MNSSPSQNHDKRSRNSDLYYSEVLNTAAAMALSRSNDRKEKLSGDEDSKNDEQDAIFHAQEKLSHVSSSYAGQSALSKDDIAKLSSLPQRPIANFPSEADRKRVIGCLATIISMMYNYENEDIMDYAPITHEESEDEIPQVPVYQNLRGQEIVEEDSFEAIWESTTPGKRDAKPDKSKSSPFSRSPTAKNSHTSTQQLMMRRYRRRRHRVYSKFLISAADLLFLEKSHAIAFLPLLNSLLGDDETVDSTHMEDIARKAKFGFLDDEDVMNRVYISSQSKRERNASTSSKEPKESWDNNDILTPFVETLEPGAGFQCISLLLLNYLLRSEGYDARIRTCVKKLGVVLFAHEIRLSEYEVVAMKLKNNKNGKKIEDILAEMATRKFEALEHAIAAKLIRISEAQQQQQDAKINSSKGDITRARGQITRDMIVRGIKIGSVGVAAGTLFAVTGGLAAPGIAAGLAASGLTAATSGVVTTLTSTAAVTTIFGVGGGGLAAYKTHRRTKGVTEFSFQRHKKPGGSEADENSELFTSICISGWLNDHLDFQRPWGVEPVDPAITDRLEKLVRFYSIYKPENIHRCTEILRRWRGEERELWMTLKEKYGRDPDHLYPIYNSNYRRLMLTLEEDEIVDQLLCELGYTVPADPSVSTNPFQDRRTPERIKMFESFDSTILSHDSASEPTSDIKKNSGDDINKQSKSKIQIPPVWDYRMEYGGELLTVTWESEMLVELCHSVEDLASDLIGQAAREILKQTALAALMTAVALPYGLARAANMIDGIWTLAIERADMAGIELARSLLESRAGHRPVILVGFSMGARTVYSCLKELSRQQEIWEEQQLEMAREKTRGMKSKIPRRGAAHSQKIEFSREPASIVEDAIIMGLPNHLSLHSWEACRSIVAGRLVNCYSQKDLILSLMFQLNRLAGALRPVCGTSTVQVKGVENYNVGDLISSHSDYCTMSGHILRMIYHDVPHRSAATIVLPSEVLAEDQKSKLK